MLNATAPVYSSSFMKILKNLKRIYSPKWYQWLKHWMLASYYHHLKMSYWKDQSIKFIMSKVTIQDIIDNDIKLMNGPIEPIDIHFLGHLVCHADWPPRHIMTIWTEVGWIYRYSSCNMIIQVFKFVFPYFLYVMMVASWSWWFDWGKLKCFKGRIKFVQLIPFVFSRENIIKYVFYHSADILHIFCLLTFK